MPVLRRFRERGASGPDLVAQYADIAALGREGPRPLREAPEGLEARERLRVAFVVPWIPRRSGGHAAIWQVAAGLERRGHACSVWVHDPEGRHAGESSESVAAAAREDFGPAGFPVRVGFEGWDGADVAVATGWQTVARVLRLDGTCARAYLVSDHEPEFHPTSAEREWAAATYRAGLHCIAASRWLAGLLRDRYGASATAYEFGIDHAVYRPLPVHRREDTVLFYARRATERRAVPLGVLALDELKRRRGDAVQIALFGRGEPLPLPWEARHLGILPPEELARAYNTATVGLVLSMTNHSLVPGEMLACGLPVVELASESMRETFGADGPLSLAAFSPIAVADAIEELLDDLALRAARAAAGLEWAASRTWDAAAERVEAGLREAIGRRSSR